VRDLDTAIRQQLADDADGTPEDAILAAVHYADALRAVLDLHHADEYSDCVECGVDVGENPIPWPCDTVRAIAGHLGVDTEETQR
jgi:hypothetical protein